MDQAHIRNFSIVAHIDHGKTTLTDRLLLATNTIEERVFTERMLDSNPIEQERGITIKMAPVCMKYCSQSGEDYQIQLIDTPGHVDFSYEVSRSLAAVEGVLLVVDVTQGVQAQTLAHFETATKLGLAIIPVLNKVDLAAGDVDSVKLEMMELMGFNESEFISVSAKTGSGITDLFERIIKKIPPPHGNVNAPLKALIFNSRFDAHKGVITNIRVFDGQVKTKDLLLCFATNTEFELPELGIFSPSMQPTESLTAGEVGYLATGLKNIRVTQVGDTITSKIDGTTEPLPGYHSPQLMVFMDLYPMDGDDFELTKDSLEKLMLNDAALKYQATHSQALGNGVRVGFLGILHAEIVQERLEREFNLNLIGTTPSVPYELTLNSGENITINSPSDMPDPTNIKEIREPIIKATVFTPNNYLGAVIQLLENHRGTQLNMEFFGNRVRLTYDLPLAELIISLVDELKSVSQGYASLEYELTAFRPVDAVKLNIMVNHELIEALSYIVVRSQAERLGRELAEKLKKVIPRQLFEIPIQASIGGKIVARETISAFRKDVTAKLYGGDITRRMKLLEKQKKGKERRKQFGSVEIPQEAFFAIMKKR